MKAVFVENLILFFPELESEIKNHLAEFPEIYLHLIFGDVFNPFLINLLNNPQANRTKLVKAGELLENMACSDENIQEVVVTTILERLSDNPEKLEAFHQFAGKQTKQFIRKTAETFC